MSAKQPINEAAWATGCQQPLSVKPAPYTRPLPSEIVIRNHAVAINPVDWIKLGMPGNLMFPWIKFPFIFGYDVSGEVVEVGSSVTRFSIGDRVLGHCCGMNEMVNKGSHSAFQLYTVLVEHMTSPIPDTLSFEKAAVVPLAFSTAACGMFKKDQLALEYPTSPRSKAGNGKTLLIWGGSTSVGVNAIQVSLLPLRAYLSYLFSATSHFLLKHQANPTPKLAVAAGYEVHTTCSPRNFPLMRSLGTVHAYDYASPRTIPSLIEALRTKTFAGALAIGPGSTDACMAILPHCKRGRRFISMATFPTPPTPPAHFPVLYIIWSFVSFSVTHFVKKRLRGVESAFLVVGDVGESEVGRWIYGDFLPRALAAGDFVASPEPVVVGRGLEFVQLSIGNG